MEKTEFEIRESVLAECQHLLGEIQVVGKKPYPDYPDISCFIDDGVVSNYTVWPFGDHSSYFIIIYTDRAAVDDQWKKAYRLLGLDKRDALEAERGKAAQEVKDERKRIEDYGMSLIEQVDPSVQEDVMRPIFEAAYAKGLREGASGLSVVMLQNVALNLEREKSKRWQSRAWKILEIVRRRETEQRPKTAAVLRTLREVSEKNEQLVTALEGIKKPWYIFKLGKRASLKSTLEQYKTRCMAIHDIASRAIEAYKEGKKDE